MGAGLHRLCSAYMHYMVWSTLQHILIFFSNHSCLAYPHVYHWQANTYLAQKSADWDQFSANGLDIIRRSNNLHISFSDLLAVSTHSLLVSDGWDNKFSWQLAICRVDQQQQPHWVEICNGKKRVIETIAHELVTRAGLSDFERGKYADDKLEWKRWYRPDRELPQLEVTEYLYSNE